MLKVFIVIALLMVHSATAPLNAAQMNTGFADLGQTGPSIAAVRAEYTDRTISFGTGIFVNQDGFVLTERHVVSAAGKTLSAITISILVPPMKVPGGIMGTGNLVGGAAEIISTDAEHDLAILLPASNPFTNDWAAANIGAFDKVVPVGVALFDTRSLRGGEKIFFSGFSPSTYDLKMVAGKIAALKVFSSQRSKYNYYLADLKLGSGINEGPAFSAVNSAVIGMCNPSLLPLAASTSAEARLRRSHTGAALGFKPSTNTSSGSTPVLPSNYMTDFLRTNGVKYSSFSLRQSSSASAQTNRRTIPAPAKFR